MKEGKQICQSKNQLKRVLFTELKNRKSQFATGTDEAVFYGGRLEDGTWNSDIATGFANQYGKKTIGHTDGGKWLHDQIALLKDNGVNISHNGVKSVIM